MNSRLLKCVAVIPLLLAILADTASQASAKAAPYSFDSVWFYRDGTRVVPEIGRNWVTVVFEPRDTTVSDFAPTDDGAFKKKAEALLKSNDSIVEYLCDSTIADDACFFRMRAGLKPADLGRIIDQVSQDRSIRYVHPTLVLNNRTYAYFNAFEMEWKTGTPKAQRESLLRAVHATLDENDEQKRRYTVDITAIPFFRALGLLAEDIRVLTATPTLIELRQSVSTRLSLYMSGGNIGDSIPFTLTITFSDRVSIDPSSIATVNLRPPELQKELFDCSFDPYDYAKAVGRSPIVITGRLRFYAPGEFTIPPVRISYSCPSCPDKTVHSIETEPVLFKVSSIIPAAKSETRLMVPTDPVSPRFDAAALHRQTLVYQWGAIASFAALALCALWLFLLVSRAKVKRDRLEVRKDHRQLADQLRALLGTAPGTPHWRYLGEAGNLLRGYLVLRCGADPKYRGGSGREFMATIGAGMPEECNDSLGAILTAIDNSVALESEHCEDLERLRRDILAIVDRTASHAGTQE
jgi:hypothetical protein